MIVRELITSLGIDFDARGADAAEKKIGSLKGALETVGTVLTFGGVFAGLKGIVGYASDAEQTLSKLRLNFEDNTQGVLDWADATAKATGESKYQLREFAGTFGSMLVPTLDFDREKAAQMSETLSGLAVDLAAINNEKPEETMQRLFSGMTGSSEAVERLGINIKALALQEYAREQGITKAVNKMSVREKAELIYGKILADTRDKVGAAAKEADSYAGRMLRLSAAVRDAATTLGQKLLPYASDFVGLLTRGVGLLGEWAGDTNKVAAAFTTLGSVLAAMGLRLVIANLPLIAFAAGLALVTIAVNDLLTAFSGGRSAIGTFMEMLVGDKNWDRLSKLPSKIGDVLFEMGLTPEQKKQRGIAGPATSTGIMDFVAPFLGEDPEALKKRLSAGEKRSNERAGTAAGGGNYERLGGSSFLEDLVVTPVWKQDVRDALQSSPPTYFGANGPMSGGDVNQTVIIQGSADSATVREIKEATRQALLEERRNLYNTTRNYTPPEKP